MNKSDPDRASLSYRDSGVDIDAGNALVERIKPLVKRTDRKGVMGGIGGFGGLFELPVDRYRQPILVSGTDGVGTKLKLANMMATHDTIGIDLVAMCVNDIIVTGAEPLYFLDYYATGKLDLDIAEAVIGGIAEGCCQAGCALSGGETAEMPGMYKSGDYDLAGFAVGVVEKSKMLNPTRVRPGQALLGLGSTGPHSNGYSLIRKIIERSGASLEESVGATTLGLALLAPTRIYVKSILALLEQVPVSAISHITGGGITENLPRVLPDNVAAEVDVRAWPRPAVFEWLAKHGNIVEEEMRRTFNCGIGMIVVVDEEDVATARGILIDHGERVDLIGRIVAGNGAATVKYTDL